MGRHSHGGRAPGAGVWIAGLAGAVVLASGGAWAVGAVLSDDASSSELTSSHSDHASGSSSTSEDPTPTSTPSSAAAAADDPTSACTAEVDAAEDVVTAVAASAKSWREHTEGQTKLDSGDFTRQQTLDIWASSKARGPADVRRYDAAAKQLKDSKAAASCASATEADDATAEITDCADRLTALLAVDETGSKVHRQWATHLDMMSHKHESAGPAYGARWARMVTAAAPALDRYDTAVADLADAPACD